MVWSWSTFFSWIDIWSTVGTLCWEDNWLGDTVSEGLSLWKIWAVLETDWVGVGSWDWDVSWLNVCGPWSISLGKSIRPWGTGNTWIHVWKTVPSLSWEWNGLSGTVSEGISFWSVWAVFVITGWIGSCC